MQNWYSQNKPARSNGVGDGAGEGIGGAVGVGIATNVARTASWISAFGLDLGKEHAVTINTIRNKRR